MTIAETPTPVVVPIQGGSLDISGVDVNGSASVLGLTSPVLSIEDPGGQFTFTPAADGFSATIVPLGTTPDVATVSFAAGTTLDDGTPGPAVAVTWSGEILPGNAVSVAINFTPNPVPVPDAAATADADAAPAAEAPTGEAPAA